MMSMRALPTALCTSVTVLLLSVPAVPVPVFQWLEPYGVTFTVLTVASAPGVPGVRVWHLMSQ
jgi:hypothetical protein